MRYRVTFRKRFNQEGQGSDEPVTLLNLPEGVVQDSSVVETFQPDNLHGEERMDEDDDFLPFGSEIWEFEVADGREKEFEDAVVESGAAMELPEQVSDPAS